MRSMQYPKWLVQARFRQVLRWLRMRRDIQRMRDQLWEDGIRIVEIGGRLPQPVKVGTTLYVRDERQLYQFGPKGWVHGEVRSG